MRMSPRFLMTLTIVATAMVAAAPAAAQYPTKPLRMVVPFPAGGATDTIARVIGTSPKSNCHFIM